MARYLQASQANSASSVVTTISREGEFLTVGSDVPQRGTAFVVKLRDGGTRMWGNEVEVVAPSAQEAAELVSGERLRGGTGDRASLRARVWKLPFGSVPDVHFFADPDASGE